MFKAKLAQNLFLSLFFSFLSLCEFKSRIREAKTKKD